jgi:DnaJ-class molecular chaperone
MKCPNCDGTGRSIQRLYYGRYIATDCLDCDGHGWLPYWTESERAGLKAMGDEITNLQIDIEKGRSYGMEYLVDRQGMKEAVMNAIQAYVKASRAVKEGK